jgi:hypothetical protein
MYSSLFYVTEDCVICIHLCLPVWVILKSLRDKIRGCSRDELVAAFLKLNSVLFDGILTYVVIRLSVSEISRLRCTYHANECFTSSLAENTTPC